MIGTGWRRFFGVCLVMAAMCLPDAHAQNQTAPEIFTVCTANRPPMSICDPNKPPETYGGLSIDVFREAVNRTLDPSWRQRFEFRYVCLSESIAIVIDRLANNTGECDAFMAAVTINGERKDRGIKFVPYYKGAVGTMVKSEQKSQGWNWLRPFTWQMWLVICIGMFIWPFLVLMLEAFSLKKSFKSKTVFYGYEEASYQSIFILMFGESMQVRSKAARFATCTFAFAALVITSTYTANLAALLTTNSFQAINDLNDLRGTAIASIGTYASDIQTVYGLQPVPETITNIDVDGTNMVTKIEMGIYKAFMYDQPMLRYVVSNTSIRGCPVRLFPNPILPFDYGLALRSSSSLELVEAFSTAFVKLQEDRDKEQDDFISARAAFYENQGSSCLEDSENLDATTAQITVKSMFGIWIVIICGLLVGMGCTFFARWWHNKHNDWPGDDDEKGKGGRMKGNRVNGTTSSKIMSPDIYDNQVEHEQHCFLCRACRANVEFTKDQPLDYSTEHVTKPAEGMKLKSKKKTKPSIINMHQDDDYPILEDPEQFKV